MTNDTTMHAISARFAGGRCSICYQTIQKGDLIVKYGGWVHEPCVGKQREALDVQKKAEAYMLENHHIALGVWGIPKGSKPTSTRGEFLTLCKRYNALTADELGILRWWWAGMLERDLSD